MPTIRQALDNPVDDPQLRKRLIDVLFSGGYPDYALSVNGFRRVVSFSGSLIGATNYCDVFLNEALSDEELSLVYRHEVLHVLLFHKRRCGRSRKPRLWNTAADFELSNY